MAMVVEQNQLFVLDGSKRGDMEGPVSIHQDDLVIGEGRCGTELGQGIVAARTQGHVGFMVELQSQGSLEGFSLSNGFLFWVLVYLGFGYHQGPCTTEFIPVLNSDDRFGIPCYCLKCGMTGFATARFAGSLRRMMDLGDGQLKRIVHFKLFIAVEGLGQPIEEGVHASTSFALFTGS